MNPNIRLRLESPALRLAILGSAALIAANVAVAQTQDTVTGFAYDNMGSVKVVTRPLGRSAAYTYDALKRVSQLDMTVGTTTATTKKSYDGIDQVISITDPRSMSTAYAIDGLGAQTQLNSPDTQTTSYTVDENANVLTSTDARGKTSSFQYDGLGRLLQARYQTGEPSQFEYDGGPGGPAAEIGNLTRVIDESGTTVFTHDLKGRVLTKTQAVNAGGVSASFTISYRYGTSGGARGKLERVTYPSGSQVSYYYDQNGRVESVKLSQVEAGGAGGVLPEVPLLTNIKYSPTGDIRSWDWGNALLPGYQRTYDLDGRLTSYPIDLSGMIRTASYNAANLITGYSHAGGLNPAQYDQSFGYDTADRLISFTLGGTTTGYSYDSNGNRTQQSGPNVTYTYATASNRLNSAAFEVPRTYSYDNAGNLVGDGLYSYTYSDRGRLAQVRGNVSLHMFYNAIGQRVLKAKASGPTYYVYDEDGHTVGEYGQDSVPSVETVYLGDLPIAVLAPQHHFYIVSDHIRTPLVVTNENGEVVWDWRNHDPFGNGVPTASTDLPFYNQRFPGQMADVETGLFYNYFRDYDPRTGRYVQSDPIGLKGGTNTYAYVEGNPVSYVDPHGDARKGGKTGQWWEFTDRNFQRWFHQCVKDPGDPDASRAELADAYGQWIEYGKPDGKNGCGGPPPPPTPAATCGDACQSTATVVAAGGAAYIIYRCIRMAPSLLPPFWPTIPANMAIP